MITACILTPFWLFPVACLIARACKRFYPAPELPPAYIAFYLNGQPIYSDQPTPFRGFYSNPF